MDSETSVFDRRGHLREAGTVRVGLAPRDAGVWVTPFCGAEADRVMVALYDGAGLTHFFSVGEAIAIADAIRSAAQRMANAEPLE